LVTFPAQTLRRLTVDTHLYSTT